MTTIDYNLKGKHILGNASVYGNACVSENARVYGDARVSENAFVYGNACVSENAQVYKDAHVSENARVYGDARVYGNVCVSENARVYGNACVSENAFVYGDARVYKDAQVYGDARVYGDACVAGNALIEKTSDYLVIGPAKSSGRFTTAHRDSVIGVRVNCGCFSGTVKDFSEAIEKTHKDNKEHLEQYRLFCQLIAFNFEVTE